MKKVLVGIIFLIIILGMTSCKEPTNEEILNSFKKSIDSFESYESVSKVIVKSNKGETSYKFNETYIKPDKIKLEILEPKESLGCIIIYDGNKIFLKHPSINQTISMDNIKSLDKSFFIGNFYENLSLCENPHISTENIEDKEYITLTINLPNQTEYRYKQKIWLNKEDFVPYKLNLIGKDGIVNTEVYYEKFKYNKVLDEDI